MLEPITTALDPISPMAKAVAAPGGDSVAISLLGAFIAEQTRGDLFALAALVGRTDAHFEAKLLAVADKTSNFDRAWRPHMGGLLQLRRCMSDSLAKRVAIEIVQAEALGVRPIGEPHAAAFCYRTAEDAERGSEAVSDAHEHYLRSGLALIRTLGSKWTTWVCGSVRQVAPIPTRDREVASWSSLFYPGLVSMTLLFGEVDVAETLVHEAAHQWWHMLDRIAPLVESDARSRLVYSPVKRCLRPLPSLALTFHAFGNIALFFSALRQSGRLGDAEWAIHSSDLYRWLPEMAATLRSEAGMTPDGRNLNVELDHRLEEEFYPLRAVVAA